MAATVTGTRPIVPLSGVERMIIDLLSGGAATRPALAVACGLPVTTVTSAVARLVRKGLVQEQPGGPLARAGHTGRPPVLYELVPARGVVGVLVVSRRTLRVGVVGQDRRVLAAVGAAFDAFGPAASEARLTEAADGLLQRALGEAGVDRADLSHGVVSVPYPLVSGRALSVLSGMIPSPEIGKRVPPWASTDVSRVWARLVGAPCCAENDASLAALGEADRGAARGTGSSVLLLAGGGIGAGIVVGGRLVRGASGFAGEVGHMQVDPSGPPCGCGGSGCLVGLPATRAALTQLSSGTLVEGRTLLVQLGTSLGDWVAAACSTMAPDVVVLACRRGPAALVLAEAVRARVRDRVPSPLCGAPPVLVSALGDDAVLVGAVALLDAAVARA